MSIADELASDVAALLNDPDYGRAATYHHASSGTYDEDTQTAVENLYPYATRVMMLSYSDRAIDGTNILRGDRKAVVMARDLPVVPAEGDELTVAAGPTEPGGTFDVIGVKVAEVGGTVFYYALQVRRGG